ncbi:MAG: transposase [Kiritimatiellae bacterium]|nr:transposase [Kiritimatiellia bacterium]
MNCIQKSIGVDVSKSKLDIYIKGQTDGERDISKEIPNSPAGFKVVKDLARKHEAVVCCEPTGGYEHGLVWYMHKANVPVAYTPGLLVRYYAKSQGYNHKNDKIDAKMIAEFAINSQVKLVTPKDMLVDRLCREVRLYHYYLEMGRKPAGMLEHEYDADSRRQLAREVKHYRLATAKQLEKCIAIAESDPQLADLLGRMCLVRGVSSITALSIIAELPEIGRFDDAKLFAMAGLAPVEKQSGDKEWRRKIYGGRQRVRSALYMSAIACLSHNTILREYYQKKRYEGHPFKWCIVPVMRKLLSLLNAIARNPNFVPIATPAIKRK